MFLKISKEYDSVSCCWEERLMVVENLEDIYHLHGSDRDEKYYSLDPVAVSDIEVAMSAGRRRFDLSYARERLAKIETEAKGLTNYLEKNDEDQH